MLQALGVEVDIGPQSVARCVEEAGVGFMYAPRYDPACKRREQEHMRPPSATFALIAGIAWYPCIQQNSTSKGCLMAMEMDGAAITLFPISDEC